MQNYNYMSYKVYKNEELVNSGVCDPDKVKDELINDFTAQLFYKTCKITGRYYKKIEVTWTNIVATDTFKTVRLYEERKEV